MAKKFYAGSHYLGKNFSYDTDGWTVFVFETKEARDEFVNENTEKHEAITRDVARRIVGSNVQEAATATDGMSILEPANGYYNANYWG